MDALGTQWVHTRTRTTKTSVVPQTVRSRNDLIDIDPMGDYTVNALLARARDSALLGHTAADRGAGQRAHRPVAATPPTRAGGYFSSPAYGAVRTAYAVRYGERWWYEDHLFRSYEAECRSMDTAAAPAQRRHAHPPPAMAPNPGPDPRAALPVAYRALRAEYAARHGGEWWRVGHLYQKYDM